MRKSDSLIIKNPPQPAKMPTLYAKTEINAPRSHVWQVLMDKHQWFHWNTFFYDLSPDRPFRQGKTVRLSIKRVMGEEETQIEPLVTLVQPLVCLSLRYTAPGFRSEHWFELQDLDSDRTQYLHRETLSGALTTLLLPFIRRDEQHGLRRMAQELKRYAEQE